MPVKNILVHAVIFDMDGVITNTMPDHHRAWAMTLKNYGVHLTHHDVYSREGQPGDEALKEILQRNNILYAQKDIQRILKEKEEYFKKYVKQRFVVGSRSFLKKLSKEGFQLALVTGTSRHELHKILPDPIYNLFSVIVTGCDVQTGKPHPEPFLKALKNLNIRAREAIVIENAPYGIQSARAAGLRVLALETSLDKKYLKGAFQTFKTIKQLTHKIRFQLI